MLSVKNKIVEVSHVRVPASGTAGVPLVRLSALDAPWVAHPLIQRVLLFDDDGGRRPLPPFESLVGSLRASLAATLARYLPLAGRIVHVPSTGDAAIDCSEGDGVRFVVAESDGGSADAGRLAGDADQDVEAFEGLVPELQTGELPAETAAVQVTRLRGGLAVGVALHHAVVDGRSVWSFLKAWAAACRGDKDAVAAPTFDRAAIKLPGGEELARSTLRKYAPDLPLVTKLVPDGVGPKLPRRTFTISTQQIHRLKQRIADLAISPPSAQQAVTPSSFVAVAAHAWASVIQTKRPAADEAVYLFFWIDCRGRPCFDPPVSEAFFGTCITAGLATAAARDLLREDDGVAAAAAAVQAEIRRAAADPLAWWDWLGMATGRLEELASSPHALDRLVNVSGSTRFPAYEATDFGWGQPSRTELVTMNMDGQVVLVAAKGGVQASVCVHPDHMDAFKSRFTSSLL